MNRAFATLEIKRASEDERVIEGVASHISVDRQGDVLEPRGAQFRLPYPLLMGHDANAPIGNVVQANVTDSGIAIRAQLAKVDEPGILKDRLDAAWQGIRAGLWRGLSVGFQPIESVPIKTGRHFKKWSILETSVVSIPANAEASIVNIKRYAGGAEPITPPTVDIVKNKKRTVVTGHDEKGRISEYETFEVERKDLDEWYHKLFEEEFADARTKWLGIVGNMQKAHPQQVVMSQGQYDALIFMSKGALAIAETVKRMTNERLLALEQRSTLSYEGVWDDEKQYQPGNFVTVGGSMWHAQRPSKGVRPGTTTDWVLAVKSGKDAR